MASVAKREWTGADGKPRSAFVVRYKEGGKHRSRQFERKKEADAYRRKVETEIESGVHVADADGRTLEASGRDFSHHIDDRAASGSLGAATAESYQTHLRCHILPYLGHRKFHELRPVDVHDWFRGLTKTGFARRKCFEHSTPQRGLDPQTARKSIGVLSLYFKWAVIRGLAKINPCPDALEMIGGIRKPRIETFSRSDVLAIIAAAEVKPRQDHHRTHALVRCFVHLAVFCGLRLGEIMALTEENVRLDAGVIQVRHTLTPNDELKGPKSRAGIRDVPMPPHLVGIMRDYIGAHMMPNPRRLIFRARSRRPPHSAQPLKQGDFRKHQWFPLLRRAGIEGGADHFHALRHFAASLMIDEGLPVTEVASLLGHSKFDTTLQVYAHPLVNGHRRRSACEAIAVTLLAAPRTIEGSITHELRTTN